MKKVKEFIARTGLESIGLIVAALLIWLYTNGNFYNAIAWVLVGMFIRGNLAIITNMIEEAKGRIIRK